MHKVQKQLLKLAEKENLSEYGLRKLGEKIGVDHPQQVKWHLQKLLKDGYLVKTSSGSIKVVDETSGQPLLARVPILGRANCGEPLIFASQSNEGYLTVSPSLLKRSNPGSLFALQAIGDSMNATNVSGQSIEEGDYVLVDGSVEVPEVHDVVVSSIEGLANIKRYERDEANQVIALVSDSTRPRPPIIIDPNDEDSYRIHGKVIRVIKSSQF